MIADKSVEEVRQDFNIVNDFNSVEEQIIINENKWCIP